MRPMPLRTALYIQTENNKSYETRMKPTSSIIDFQDEFSVPSAVHEDMQDLFLTGSSKSNSKKVASIPEIRFETRPKTNPDHPELRISQSFTNLKRSLTNSLGIMKEIPDASHQAQDDCLNISNLLGFSKNSPQNNRRFYNFQMGLLNTMEANRLRCSYGVESMQ